VKYALSGGLAAFVHVLVFYTVAWKLFPALQSDDILLAFWGISVAPVDVSTRAINAMLSNIVAFLVSNFLAYICNIYWVFEPGRHHKVVEIGLFYIVSGISMTIGTVLMGYLIQGFNLQTTLAFTANIISAVAINYLLRKFYIFKG